MITSGNGSRPNGKSANVALRSSESLQFFRQPLDHVVTSGLQDRARPINLCPGGQGGAYRSGRMMREQSSESEISLAAVESHRKPGDPLSIVGLQIPVLLAASRSFLRQSAECYRSRTDSCCQ